MRYMLTVLCVCLLLSAAPYRLAAHCEIPCGIYDDPARITLIREHIQTIEKSMKMIHSLSQEEAIDYNQLVRWINNKEKHADELQHIVMQYFMTQRVKPAAEPGEAHGRYLEQVTALHKLLIAAMKSKQTIDGKYIDEMRLLLNQFEESYFEKE